MLADARRVAEDVVAACGSRQANGEVASARFHVRSYVDGHMFGSLASVWFFAAGCERQVKLQNGDPTSEQ